MIALLLSLSLASVPTAAIEGERFVEIPYSRLVVEKGDGGAGGELPPAEMLSSYVRGDFYLGLVAVLDVAFEPGPDGVPSGEGYLAIDDTTGAIEIVAKTSTAGDLHARLMLPTHETITVGSFRVTAGTAAQQPSDAMRFEAARAGHYARLAAGGIPGGAWFRHRARGHRESDGESMRWRDPSNELEDTLDMFSGARALAENLRLETVLAPTGTEAGSVAIDSLPGIETRPFDFAPLLSATAPELDPLAAFVPSDQHAVFFPSFPALVALKDELERLALPAARLADARAVDALTLERLERQLCLPLTELGRRFGTLVVAQAALTGSDPFLRSGSDVGLLFKTREKGGDLLEAYWRANVAASGKEDGGDRAAGGGSSLLREVKDGPLPYSFARTPDRSISSYFARHGDVVLITNSTVQIDALAAVIGGARKALATTDDYRFFRQRYKIGEKESALVVLPDEAIRRWVSPRWRIVDSRRVRALGRLAEERASAIDAAIANLGARASNGGAIPSIASLPAVAEPIDPVFGSLAFATPIAEIAIERCTQGEADAYGRFRDTYQRGFSAFFDPIAIRLVAEEDAFEGDVTVIPLIAESDLDAVLDICRGAKLTGGAGRKHAEAIAQLVFAIDPKADVVHELDDLLRGGADELVDPLSWVGNWVTLYFDDDSFFAELAQAEDSDDFLDENLARLPIAFEIAVKDPLRAGLFMTSLRLLADQTVPGLLTFQNLEHAGRPFVRVKADRSSPMIGGGEGADVAIHYAIDDTRLIVSPSEAIVKRYLESRAATAAPEPGAWLGESAAAHVDERALTLFRSVIDDGYTQEMRGSSSRALPILNEWKRLFPNDDPVAVHEKLFHERIVCPDGGDYVFDPVRRTMTTSLLGDLAAPKDPEASGERFGLLRGWTSLDFGLTFEHGGVRARGRIER